jgi:hypothetical protein
MTDRDRQFDDWRRPKTDRSKAIVAEVIRELQNFETRKKLRKRKRRPADQALFEETVSAIVSDLIHRALTAPQGKLSVSLSNQVLGRRWRYGSPVLSQVLPTIIDNMASPEMSWLTLTKSTSTPFSDSPRSTIAPSQRLLSRIEKQGLTLDDLTRVGGQEIVVLKSRRDGFWDQSQWLDYDDTTLTETYRREVGRINQHLAQADIDFGSAALPEKVVDVGDRYIRRYFNGSFSHGGRLYGGFWMPLSKAVRREGLSIDGESVETLDYGQMAMRLVYGMAGVEPITSDLYAIPGLIDHRKGVKALFASLLFTTKPLGQYPEGVRDMFPRGLGVKAAVEMIKHHHPAIAPYFGTGVGFTTMYKESEILIDVLNELMTQNITALPIHDAIVIPQSKVDIATAIMLDVFHQHTGIRGKVDIEGGSTFKETPIRKTQGNSIVGVVTQGVSA